MKRTLFITISVIVVILLISEITLRCVWGFGTMPLYHESSSYEYLQNPNQDIVRFGCHYKTNSYSMRSEEPDTSKTIILGLGDSVINGGAQTDNDSLATSIFSLNSKYQMLNISAGSWSADNLAAYIKEKGTFNAKGMFVLLSSHDAGDNMDFRPTVGVSVSYPKEQYSCAIAEVLDRYIIPRVLKKKKEDKNNPDLLALKEGIDKGGPFNKGWDELNAISKENNIPMTICLHAEKIEFNAGKYNKRGELIVKWANDNNVSLIKDIEYLDEKSYRDNIHLNEHGQKIIANVMKSVYR